MKPDRCAKGIMKRLAVLSVLALALALLLGCRLTGCTETEYTPPSFSLSTEGRLAVYAIDVEHGDAFLLISPEGKTMLIDAGEAEFAGRVLDNLDALGIERIDVAVGTHPHSDHIGAMPQIIEGIGVGRYIMPKAPMKTQAGDAVDEALLKKRMKAETVWNGDEIKWAESCTVRVLAPVFGCKYSNEDANDWSLILRIEYGENSFIFTGDATVHAEQLAMFHNEEELISADVLKVAHHGSASGSTLGFVEAVGADTALISVGKNNGYGHPNAEILQRLGAVSSRIYRTDRDGGVLIVSDGKSIRAETARGEG